jgi:hypothetical protein
MARRGGDQWQELDVEQPPPVPMTACRATA